MQIFLLKLENHHQYTKYMNNNTTNEKIYQCYNFLNIIIKIVNSTWKYSC